MFCYDVRTYDQSYLRLRTTAFLHSAKEGTNDNNHTKQGIFYSVILYVFEVYPVLAPKKKETFILLPSSFVYLYVALCLLFLILRLRRLC